MGSLFPDKRPLIGHQQLENPAYRQNPGPASSSNGHSYPSISKVPHHQSSVPSSSTNSCLSLEKWEADVLAFSGKESISSLVSTDFDISNRNGNGQHSINHKQGKQEDFHEDSVFRMEPTGPAEASKQPSDNWKHDDIRLEPTEVGQVDSSSRPSVKISPTTPNARKRKAEKEKAEPFNWDTLRKQVQQAGTIGRSREAMDSLDYEALRNADVREISDTIKERGMNNMLAERMKGLSIEHTRARAKERGVCTPFNSSSSCFSGKVDTNVGRIAVRLGWVPLQPLPESLQLHLLELYPVLESIQKYLWPRLCKLDQETLYELHYQMIGFLHKERAKLQCLSNERRMPTFCKCFCKMYRREPDDPSPYLLAIWTPGETADSVQPPEIKCSFQEGGGLCNNKTCFSCNSTREAQAQTVRGTILIPCRTAMRGSFPLNGTYFQVNEVFADHESSLNPIDVPRSLIWNLPRRTVFFGTSVSTIFKGMSTEDIQYCFWKGFVCVRGFDQKTRAPRPLKARLHLPASKMAKQNE
ncbi:DNA glycosylase/AP lyase ROS1 [Sesamum angolense]|uniref:DNA glycosylase/AP lyase ROS1 n=1 Tax=Sesamum angolense TaxID=2727404 RepID=A0AAE1W2P9_9LAMI|nr:DNA glycosylase/AP lyase ROS1 [Sesamum angolense]